MGMQINTNVAALNAYRNLSGTQGAMNTSLERLSSGLRINKAADDAAGLAISEKLRSQVNGLNQAQANAQDGVSLIQTAEGALNETHAILQRIRTLAVQSASDSYTSVDRASAQKEVTALVTEINSTTKRTQFNGMNLLDGTFVGKSLQIGANSGHSMDVSIEEMDAKGLYLESYSHPLSLSYSGNYNTNISISLTGSPTGMTSSTRYDVRDDNQDGVLEVWSSLSNAKVGDLNSSKNKIVLGVNSYDFDKSLKLGDSFITGGTVAGGVSVDRKQYADRTGNPAGIKANAEYEIRIADGGASLEVWELSDGGVKIGKLSDGNTVLGESGNKFTFNDKLIDGQRFRTDNEGNVSGVFDNAHGDEILGAVAAGTYRLVKDGKGGVSATLNGAEVGKLAADKMSVAFYDGSSIRFGGAMDPDDPVSNMFIVGKPPAREFGEATVDLTTRAGAVEAIAQVDKAISKLSAQRADLGALQNRLLHTVANLGVSAENLSASESRIRDADMAKEMTSFTRSQILQQAGVSMLAQANQTSQSVLKLLG